MISSLRHSPARTLTPSPLPCEGERSERAALERLSVRALLPQSSQVCRLCSGSRRRSRIGLPSVPMLASNSPAPGRAAPGRHDCDHQSPAPICNWGNRNPRHTGLSRAADETEYLLSVRLAIDSKAIAPGTSRRGAGSALALSCEAEFDGASFRIRQAVSCLRDLPGRSLQYRHPPPSWGRAGWGLRLRALRCS